MPMSVKAKLGVAIPTQGTRPDFLKQAIASVRKIEGAKLFLGVPAGSNLEIDVPKETEVIEFDTAEKLTTKLDSLVDAMEDEIEFVAWIGDDDLIYADATEKNLRKISKNPEACVIFGECDYIDMNGSTLFATKWGKFANLFLLTGPNFLPQPSSIIRRRALSEVGGFGASVFQAFDYDLFLRLSKVGSLLYVPNVTAAYRWHPDSLTVKNRFTSAMQSSRIRFSNRSVALNIICAPLEPLVIISTYLAGKFVGASEQRRRGAKKGRNIF